MYSVVCHSSEIKSLCLRKLSSETLQKIPYFWNYVRKAQIICIVAISNKTLDIQQTKEAQSKKCGEKWFYYSKNITNFESFFQAI